MSDLPSPPSPGADPFRPDSSGLPTPRPEGAAPRAAGSGEGEQISLDEMMERLQRSGRQSAGEGRSEDGGESRSGRRRRSSSSSSSSSGASSSSSSRRSSSSSRSYPEEERRHGESSRRSRSGHSGSGRSEPTPPVPVGPLTKAVLPPPRRALPEAGSNSDDTFTPRRTLPGPAGRRRGRWWLYGLLGLGVAAGATWFGLRKLNVWRIEGDGFKVNVARRVSELLGREVFLTPFRQAGGDQLFLSTADLRPAQQDLLGSATFSDLSAQLTDGSWMADDWTIRTLRIQKTDLQFQPGKKLPEGQEVYALRPDPVNRGETARGGFRLSLSSDPASIYLETGRFDQLNLGWPGPGGKPESLSGLTGTFRNLDGALAFECTGGLLDTAAWPPFAVRQINARLKGHELEIVSARLGMTAGHDMRFSGSTSLVPNGKLELNGEIPPILLKHFLPDSWSNITLGSFEAPEVSWLSHFGEGPPSSLKGKFKVTGMVLRGLPFVEKTASLLRKPDLILMEFPVLTGEFTWTPESTRISGLSAVSKDGLLRFKGDAEIVPGGAVKADLVFEASEAYFAGQPANAPQPFTATGEEGWRSLPFSLGGKESEITDTIGINTPILIDRQRLPSPASLEMPKMTVPPGVQPPAPQPSPAPAAAAVPVPAAPVRVATPLPPPPPPAVKAEPTAADLKKTEEAFYDLLGR